jgi:hypothetical protein
MGTPQIIILVLFSLGLLASAHLHGKERTPHNFWVVLISIFIEVSILIWGGFFN